MPKLGVFFQGENLRDTQGARIPTGSPAWQSRRDATPLGRHNHHRAGSQPQGNQNRHFARYHPPESIVEGAFPPLGDAPSYARTADEIAQTAQFFSFGTNDLTLTCLGMSRDNPGGVTQAGQEQRPVFTPFPTGSGNNPFGMN